MNILENVTILFFILVVLLIIYAISYYYNTENFELDNDSVDDIDDIDSDDDELDYENIKNEYYKKYAEEYEKQTERLEKQKKMLKELLAIPRKTIYSGKSKYQEIEVIELDKNRFNMKRCLVLDDEAQLCREDEHIYHEALVHIPASYVKKVENVLIIGGGDCMTLREVMKYPTLKNVTMLELDKKVVDVCKKYFNVSTFENDKRVKIVYGDALKSIQHIPNNSCDLVIVDLTEDNTNSSPIDNINFYKMCQTKMKKNAILVKNGNVIEDIIKQSFPKTASYNIYYPLFTGLYPFFIGTRDPNFSKENIVNTSMGVIEQNCKSYKKSKQIKMFD